MISLPQYEQAFRAALSPCMFYVPQDEVYACWRPEHTGHVLLGYNVNNKKALAAVSLQLEPPLCYIIRIGVREESRRKGVGRMLYDAVEQFCLQQGITTIETTPSGQGEVFWPAMGFTAIKRIARKGG